MVDLPSLFPAGGSRDDMEPEGSGVRWGPRGEGRPHIRMRGQGTRPRSSGAPAFGHEPGSSPGSGRGRLERSRWAFGFDCLQGLVWRPSALTRPPDYAGPELGSANWIGRKGPAEKTTGLSAKDFLPPCLPQGPEIIEAK